MTVRELIKELKQMPADAEVGVCAGIVPSGLLPGDHASITDVALYSEELVELR